MLRVGFIGIGNMGRGMAGNVARKLKNSHAKSELIVYDPSLASVTSFLKSMNSVSKLNVDDGNCIPIKVILSYVILFEVMYILYSCTLYSIHTLYSTLLYAVSSL